MTSAPAPAAMERHITSPRVTDTSPSPNPEDLDRKETESKISERLCRAQTRERPSLHFPLFVFLSLYLSRFDSLSLLQLKMSAGEKKIVFWNSRQPNVACHSEGGIGDQTAVLLKRH